jgi:hypothetical protein
MAFSKFFVGGCSELHAAFQGMSDQQDIRNVRNPLQSRLHYHSDIPRLALSLKTLTVFQTRHPSGMANTGQEWEHRNVLPSLVFHSRAILDRKFYKSTFVGFVCEQLVSVFENKNWLPTHVRMVIDYYYFACCLGV